MTDATGQPTTKEWIVFTTGDLRCAVALVQVVRVVRMVALTALPEAPPVILGVFDYHGEILPVASTRRRFQKPERPPQLSDQLLIVQTRYRRLALAVDAVAGVVSVDPAQIIPSAAVVPGLEFVRGITRLPGEGLVLLHDIDAFLSLDEDAQTTAALATRG